MKTTNLLIVTVLLAGFAGSTFAQGHHHHYRKSNGVALAAQIVNLVKTAITPSVAVAEPAVYAKPAVYTAPVYCAPPRHRRHHGHRRHCR